MAASKIARYSLVVLYVLVTIWLAILIMNIYDVLYNENQYSFGVNEFSQPFNWAYASSQHYFTYSIINLAIVAIILLMGYIKKHNVAVILFIIYIMFILYSMSQLD
jgi:hypothetical protein